MLVRNERIYPSLIFESLGKCNRLSLDITREDLFSYGMVTVYRKACRFVLRCWGRGGRCVMGGGDIGSSIALVGWGCNRVGWGRIGGGALWL